MNATIQKWTETIQINISKYLSYRLDFFLLTIAPSLIFFFIKYNLWHSIYSFTKLSTIKGYTFSQMLQYHALILIIGMITKSHSALDMAIEIRRGRISSYLIYPFSYFQFQAAQFLSFEFIQIFISFFTLMLFIFLKIIVGVTFLTLITTYLYCLLVAVFWFNIQFFTGILSFWLEETWVLRVLFGIIASFLSGGMMPLDLFPESFVKILFYSPFPYLGYIPVSYLSGKNVDLLFGTEIIVAWIVIMISINAFVWNKGLKKYSGAGM